jgi:arsenical pump membrane protein
MSSGLALALALTGLVITLAVAVARPPWPPEAVVAVVVVAVLIAIGAVSLSRARQAVGNLAPTIGFLAALLLLADGCRRDGLFDALGALMAQASQQNPRRLLALVFIVASAVTATLGLDPTIVLLTPVVFATAIRLRMRPKPHVYACVHLANSASLLLPISNLTNLPRCARAGCRFCTLRR